MSEVTRIGKYTVESRLGQGGMGIVYKAFDPSLERNVALKLLLPTDTMTEEKLARFYREARSAAKLHHPNIVAIHELGEDLGRVFVAMEYIEGQDLSSLMKKRTVGSLDRKLDLVIQVCNGLNYAHLHGIVHRDIKPGNIRITADGVAKIMDFGLARMENSELTQTGLIMGTPHYMSPEQIQGKKNLDGRSDLFSVGVILFELLSRKRAFDADSVTTVLYQILQNPSPRLDEALPGCAEELASIIDRSLAKDPNDRFPTCQALAEALQGFRSRLPALTQEVRNKIDALERERALLGDQTMVSGPQTPTQDTAGDPGSYDDLLRKLARLEAQKRLLDGVEGPQYVVPESGTISRAVAQTGSQAASPPGAASASSWSTAPTAAAARPKDAPPTDVLPVVPARAEPATRALPDSTPQARARPRTSTVALAGGGLALGIAVTIAAVVFRGRSAPPPSPPAAVPGGTVTLDVSPWATIASVTRTSDGQRMSTRESVAPVALDLPAGDYRFVLSNPHFPPDLTVDVTVRAGQVSLVRRTLPGFRLEDEISALLAPAGR